MTKIIPEHTQVVFELETSPQPRQSARIACGFYVRKCRDSDCPFKGDEDCHILQERTWNPLDHPYRWHVLRKRFDVREWRKAL